MKSICRFGCFVLLCYFTPIYAWEDIPPCFRYFETSFFKQELVLQAFDLHHLYQSHASTVYTALQHAAKDVPNIVRAKAKAMRPNPLAHPYNREQAEKILKQTLEEVFLKVLQENYVGYQRAINESEMKGMFGYIFSQQETAWTNCFGKPTKKTTQNDDENF